MCEKREAIVISAEAGMGKSKFCRELQKNLQAIHPHFSTVLLNVPNCSEKFHRLTESNWKMESIQDAFEFINDEKLKLKNAIVIIDGFDEFLPLHEKPCLDLIGLLIKSELQLVVTTRPQEKRKIDQVLSKLGKSSNDFELYPLEHDAKIECLSKFWERSGQSEGIDLRDRAASLFALIRRDSAGFDDSDDEFDRRYQKSDFSKFHELVGVPLHLKLVAEAVPPTDSLREKEKSLLRVLVVLSREKITSALKKRYEPDQLEEKELAVRSNLYRLALATLLGQGDCAWLSEEDSDLLNYIGLVTISSSYNKARFVYVILAEYLLAEGLVKKIYHQPGVEDFAPADVQVKEVFFERKFKPVRRFINAVLEVSDFVVMEPMTFRQDDIVANISYKTSCSIMCNKNAVRTDPFLMLLDSLLRKGFSTFYFMVIIKRNQFGFLNV